MQDFKHNSLEILNIIGGILTGLISITGLCFSIYSFIVSNQTQEKNSASAISKIRNYGNRHRG